MLTSSTRTPEIWYLKQNQTSSRPTCMVFCCCLVATSCLILCNTMDCSPPGSCVPGIFQARILEWVAISISILDIKTVRKKKKKTKIKTDFKMEITAFITATQESDAMGTRIICRRYLGGNPTRNTALPGLENFE